MDRQATPKRDRRATPARRVALALLAAVVLGAVLLAAAAGWLLGSDSGSAWLLTRWPGTSVSGSSGRLSGGPFAARQLQLQAGGRSIQVQGLAWQAARWQWRPHDGAWVGLTLVEPRAERITIGATTSTAALAAPASLRLPFALSLERAQVGTLQIEGQSPLSAVVASAELGADGGRLHRIGELAFSWDRAQVQARGTLAADAPFALDARAELRSRDAGARAWQALVTARGPLAALALQGQLGSADAPGATLQAQARVEAFAAWPLASLAATTQDLDLGALASELPTTRLSGRAEFDTRGLDAPIRVRIALNNTLPGRWDHRRLPIGKLDLELGGRARERTRLEIRQLALQLADGAGRIDGSGLWQGSEAHLDLRLQAVRPAALDARAAAMTLGGTLGLQLHGLPAPDGSLAAAARQTAQARVALDGRLDARSALPLQLRAQADGERSGAAWRVDLRELDARSGAARAQASLQAERTADGALQLRSRGELVAFDPGPWFPGAATAASRQGPHRLAGRWHADLQASAAAVAARPGIARWLALRGQAHAQLSDSLLAGVALQGRVDLDGRTPGWAVDADLQAGGNRLALQGRLAPRAADDRWRLDLDAPSLATLQALANLHPALAATPLAGRLAGRLQAQGRWPASASSGTLRTEGLQAARLRAQRLEARWQAGASADAPLDLQLEGEQLAVDTLRIGTLQARIDGSLAGHRISVDATTPLRPPAWTDTLLGGQPGSRIRLKADGQWSPGRWRASNVDLEAGGHGTGAHRAATASWLRASGLGAQLQLDAAGRPVEVRVEPGRVELLGAALRWTQASWRAAQGSTAAQAALDAELEPLAVAPWLVRLQPGAGWGGTLTLAGRAQLRAGDRFAADLVLERHAGDLSVSDDTGTHPFGLTDLRLAIAAQDGTWHFTQAVAGANLGVLAGAQSLRLTPQARWPDAGSPMQGVLEWQIADLGAWAPFTPPGWRLGGTLRTGAALGGTFGAPEITGQMSGKRLALRNLLQGVDVRDGELALSLRGSRASIDRFVLQGGAGELRVTGGADLGAEPSAKLQLHAERFQVLGRFDRRLITSGDAELALAAQSLQLDGRLHIDEGLIDFSRADAPSLDSDVEVVGGRAAAPAAPSTDAAPRGSAAPYSSRVALQVDMGEQLRLRGRGLDTLLRGRLALSTPGGRLAVTGSVRTEAGTYAAYSQKLAIERGVLGFNGAADNPRLDILAVRPNLDLRVGVLVSGTAQNPRVRLFSEPEMSDTDKLSWLVLGRAPDGLARADTALLQRAALALLAGEGEGLDNALLGSIGLDEFSVRQSESADVKDTVVTVGKQLSRRWYIGYERGVNSTTGTWQLIYRVAQRLTVRAQASEDNALDAIWTWRWN